MPAYNPFNCFTQDVAHGVHNLATGVITVALTGEADAPNNGMEVLADLTQIDYTNVVSRALTTSSSEQVDGVYRLKIADFNLTADGGAVGPFRYIVLYNDSAPADNLLCWYDIGVPLTIQDQQFVTFDFNDDLGVVVIQFPVVAP